MYGLLFAVLAAAPSQPALAARAVWQVSYIDSMCIVARQFGPASSPATMAIKTTPLSRSIEINLQTEGDNRGEEIGTGQLLLAPSGTTLKIGYWSVVTPRPYVRLTRYFVGNVDQKPFAAASTLTLKSGNSTDVTLAVEGMSLAMRSLDQCVRDAALRWGAEAKAIGAVASVAEPLESPARWYPPSSYPKAALRARVAGPTTMLWTVDATGRVIACKVVGESGSAALDAASCAAIQDQIKFKPATDKHGEPIVSYVSQRVNWHIPFGGKRLPTTAPNRNSPFYAAD